jgi:hypothetical protein
MGGRTGHNLTNFPENSSASAQLLTGGKPHPGVQPAVLFWRRLVDG